MDLKGKRILIVGASSDIATSLNKMLVEADAIIGFHFYSNKSALRKYKESKNVRFFQKNLSFSNACYELVDQFVEWANGIDCLVQLSGDIKEPIHWEKLKEKHWWYDLNSNLIMPFFLAQRAISHMKEKGGRVILMSTASATHGGGATSMPYGVAKAGIECMVKGLARDCARYNILVNAIAPGFIKTKFHTEKMKRTDEQLRKRAELIPLKRPGTTEEIAGAILFLLSDHSSYITGQTIAVSGGDWL
ncbi:NAD(P)-dependent oxidoreductase [hot springs metagenome]